MRVLKRILEDSKKHKKSKWWETTRKYMNWAQIEEREIKEKTAKEIRGKIAKVVEEEWREEMEKKNSLRIYRRFKKEMKEEDYSGSLESMVWLRARTNSLNLGENSWQRNRDVCVGCSEERETLERVMLKVALDGGTRPGDTLQIHPHFLTLMGDGQANAFRWRDTSPRATLSVVL